MFFFKNRNLVKQLYWKYDIKGDDFKLDNIFKIIDVKIFDTNKNI
jgi:hypothetical protein